jgi:aminoglycoside phosphotransferase (APT) family kinase protein
VRRGRLRSGQTLAVGYNGRGAVVWRDGRVRYAGPRCQRRIELEAAVEALFELENVDLASRADVRDALLTIGGARLLRDPLAPIH